MSDYIVGLVLVVVILLVPLTRKAAVRLLGLTAIAGIAVAGIGLPVWGLYEARSWLISAPPVREASAPDAPRSAQSTTTITAEQEEDQRRLEDERQRKVEEERQVEEERKIEEEQLRIAELAERARSVVDRERTYAMVAASYPQLAGLDQVSLDLIRIRIPSWRDGELAEREKGLIRVWLQSIGLTREEIESIHSANGWGSVYDLWRKETTSEETGPDTPVPAASVPETSPPPETGPDPEPQAQPPPRAGASPGSASHISSNQGRRAKTGTETGIRSPAASCPCAAKTPYPRAGSGAVRILTPLLFGR